ncbi:MAG: hypothetical protein ACJAQ9_000004 [Ilumatobacter sp.]|jgi:hypothetical protein
MVGPLRFGGPLFHATDLTFPVKREIIPFNGKRVLVVDSGNVVQLFAGSEADQGDLGQLTFDSILDGWRKQMLSRNLAFSTIDGRERPNRPVAYWFTIP